MNNRKWKIQEKMENSNEKWEILVKNGKFK